MQAVGETQSGSARQINRRRNIAPIQARGRTEKPDDVAARLGNDFLTGRFKPVACSSIARRKFSSEPVEYMTRENYEYLRDSYFRYAELLGRAAPHDPGDSIGMGMSNLVDEMTALVKGEADVNVDYDYEQLFFTLYKASPWDDMTLFWFPVRFMEKLNPRLRRICVTFFHDLMKSNGFSTILDECDTEMTEYWLSEQLDELDKCDQRSYMKVLDSYNHGRAWRLLDRVWRRSYYKNLPGAIRRYRPANDYEAGLLALLTEGLQFIGRDKPSLMRYEYDPYEEEDPYAEPILLERQVRVVYDPKDLFTECLMEMFNCDQQQANVLQPYYTLRLSPQTDRLLETDDYPEKFYKWANELVCHIE